MKKIINKLNELLNKGKAAVVVSCIAASFESPTRTGFKMLVEPDKTIIGTVGGGAIEKDAIEQALNVYKSKTSFVKNYELTLAANKMNCGGNATLFFEYYPAGKRLFVFGAGHICQTLVPIMNLMNFEVTVIDNRAEYLTSVNIEAKKVNGVYTDMISEQKFTESDSIVICTHGHEHDQEILNLLIEKDIDYKYLGMIGSKHKVKNSLEMLDKQPKMLYAPIGINIATKNSNEIALAIACEIIAVHNNQKKLDFCYKKLMEK